MTYPSRRRKIVGWILIVVGGLLLPAISWYKSHCESLQLQARIDLGFAIFASDHRACVVTDRLGHVIIWNYGMEKLTGVSCEQAMETGIDVILCDPEKYGSWLAQAFADPKSFSKLTIINCDIFDAKGVRTPVRMSVSIVRIGQVDYVAVTRIDRETQIVEYGKKPS